MTRPVRLAVFAVGMVVFMLGLGLALLAIPSFGASHHLYRDLAVGAAVAHHTANVVSSVNFDQRGVDTFGEETILVASVIGAAALLRPGEREHRTPPPSDGYSLPATQLVGYLLLPVTLLVGFDLVLHGQVTPGGGFQGGVVLATGLHLVYITGNYPALHRLRPFALYETAEAVGAALFAGLGIAGTFLGGAFLANIFSPGTFGQLFSGGTVPVLNVAVGVEVTGGIVVLLGSFLRQEIEISAGRGPGKRPGTADDEGR